MRRSRRILSAAFAIGLALAPLASAEIITVNITEPTASGTLLHTTIYNCLGVSCNSWKFVGRKISDNKNGGDTHNVPMDIPLVGGTLPVAVRIRVTATDTSGNETAGAFYTHTFTP